MVDENQLERRMRKLDESKEEGRISAREHELIADFKEYDLGDNKRNTVSGHVHALRITAERSEMDLADMDTDDVNDLLGRFRTGTHPDVKEDGIIIKNYESALSNFYDYHDDLNVSTGDIDGGEDDYNGRELSPSDLLYKEDVDAIFAACHRRSIRDLAAHGILLATGLRLDAVRTLRLKHVEQDGAAMTITLNEEEGALKGASGSRALLWAKHYVRPWVEAHPHKGNPDAALFPAADDSANQHEQNYTTEPMADRSFRRMVRKRAEEAGIEKDVYPHLFRHTAITRMVVDDRLSEQQIKHIAGWHGDSSQFDRYVTLADQIVTDSVREALGLPTSESGTPVVGRPTLDDCPECGERLPEDTERCPTCRTPMTHAEAEGGEPETTRPEPEELVADMSDEEKLELIDALRDELRS